MATPLEIAWLTTGRGPGSYGALEYVLRAIERGLPVRIAVVFVNRERGEAEATDRLIALAEAAGAEEVELVSSSVLPTAKHLYKKLGFRDIPLGEMVYARADIRMSKSLAPSMSVEG